MNARIHFRTLVLLAPILCLARVAHAQPAKEAPAFDKAGLAFLQKHCLHCHGEKAKKAGLSLHTFRTDADVLKDRKIWRTVLHMVKSGEMPPPEKPRPSVAEVETFAQAVDGVFIRAARNAPDPGQVTIRRLNRAEYYNTIRDLIGVDFNPAEDFPADGVGYGFDNIGDVLSLSPVLLERYLTAAETIVQRVHLSAPRKPNFKTSSVFLVPQGNDIKAGFRPLANSKARRDMRVTAGLDGEYILRGRVYGVQIGDEPVKATLHLNEKPLKTFEVKAADPKSAEIIELKIVLKSTPKESFFGITLANEFKNGDGQRTLWVEYLDLVPPEDGRPAVQQRLFTVDAKRSKLEKTREILERFAGKAYRRPAEAAEIDRLVKLAEAAEKRGKKWDDSVKLVMTAVLVSPKFLFRVELDDRPDSAQPHAITEHQLASRLSYFLWSSMPDDELFAEAEKKTLTKNLDTQVKRMLADPRSRALVDNFAMQWLQLRRLQVVTPDPKLFPSFNEPLRKAMLKETELFFEAIIREDRSILDLIDADFTFVNEPLAKHYGIKLPSPSGRGAGGEGDAFQRVKLDGKERGGILTHASVLTVTSNPTRTSPVKRGHWVLEQILGTPPPPPPPNVPELPESPKAIETASLRQRLEQHRSNPACANCHSRIDPIGFAFENYDSIGAYRSKDGKFDIDPSGTLPDGKTFKGPAELKAILLAKKELFSRCLTEKMLTYAVGRGTEFYDTPAIDRIAAALAKDGYRFSTLVVEIAKSDPFLLRRGKGKSQ